MNDIEAAHRSLKRQGKMPVAVDADGNHAELGPCLREMELAKVDLETPKLALEQRCQDELIKERAAKRVHQVADTKANERNDMARLQAMLDFAVASIQTATRKRATDQ